MPVELVTPEQPPVLTHARVMRVEIEDNIERSATLYVSLGVLDADDNFVEWRHPVTGLTATRKIKMEDGHHPLTEQALGQCPECSKWWAATVCPECEGSPALTPYDGHTRMTQQIVGALGLSESTDIRTVIGTACYVFLISEEVPDPDTWEMRKLISAQPPV